MPFLNLSNLLLFLNLSNLLQFLNLSNLLLFLNLSTACSCVLLPEPPFQFLTLAMPADSKPVHRLLFQNLSTVLAVSEPEQPLTVSEPELRF